MTIILSCFVNKNLKACFSILEYFVMNQKTLTHLINGNMEVFVASLTSKRSAMALLFTTVQRVGKSSISQE